MLISRLLVFVPLLLLTGCCVCPKEDKRSIPPPISLHDQLFRLNARAAALDTLRAKGQVAMDWRDEQGSHSHSADGTMLLRQADAENHPRRDVVIFGRIAGQDVFEVGANSQFRWLALRTDPPRAYVQVLNPNAESPPLSTPPARLPGNIPFAADRVLDVLALAPLLETPGTRLVMTVSDRPAVNEVLVLQIPPDRPAWVERIVTIDRRSGEVSQVRLFYPTGLLEAVAHLSEYALVSRPPPAPGDGEPAATLEESVNVALPRKVSIEYPASQARVQLNFDQLRLDPKLLQNRQTFTLPDFQAQGFRMELAR